MEDSSDMTFEPPAASTTERLGDLDATDADQIDALLFAISIGADVGELPLAAVVDALTGIQDLIRFKRIQSAAQKAVQ